MLAICKTHEVQLCVCCTRSCLRPGKADRRNIPGRTLSRHVRWSTCACRCRMHGPGCLPGAHAPADTALATPAPWLCARHAVCPVLTPAAHVFCPNCLGCVVSLMLTWSPAARHDVKRNLLLPSALQAAAAAAAHCLPTRIMWLLHLMAGEHSAHLSDRLFKAAV